MAFDAMMLGVYKVPEITVNSGTDWVVLAGTVLTAFIVALGTWTTIRNFNTTTKAQEDLAEKNAHRQLLHSKAEAVSRNRQEWINNLRSAISSFTAACFELYSVNIIMQTPTGIVALSVEETLSTVRLHREIVAKHASIKGEARRYLSEIQLFINPTEAPSAQLVITAINMYQAADSQGNIYLLSDQLIEQSQQILKTEWERVKDMV